jgi:hypothetical protein
MTLLDLTIVNIAIPSVIDGLHASLDQVVADQRIQLSLCSAAHHISAAR